MTTKDNIKAVLALKRAGEEIKTATGYSAHTSLIDLLTLISHVADDIAGSQDILTKLDAFQNSITDVLTGRS